MKLQIDKQLQIPKFLVSFHLLDTHSYFIFRFKQKQNLETFAQN